MKWVPVGQLKNKGFVYRLRTEVVFVSERGRIGRLRATPLQSDRGGMGGGPRNGADGPAVCPSLGDYYPLVRRVDPN